jgi:hypothetical protein
MLSSNQHRSLVNIDHFTEYRHLKHVKLVFYSHHISAILTRMCFSSATTLILSRFAQDDSSASALTLDLFSPNSDTRRKAKQLLDLFDNIGTEIYPLRDSAVSALHDKSGPTTQIMCRAFFRASRRYRRGLASLRDIAEVVEDSTIIDSAPSQTPRYPDSHFAFPYPLAPLNDSDVGVRFHPASQRVESLVELLADQALTTRPMVRFASSGASSGASSTSDQPLQEENDIAGDAVFTARAPTLSQSNREAEVRRQRREAMVLHEGEGVIGRENIIHPRREHGA